MLSNLKIGCWNIHQLKSTNQNKLNDPIFVREVSKYYIFCLQKTKLSNNDVIYIDNFKSFTFSRPNENGFPTPEGMLIFIKPSIVQGITILIFTYSDIKWVKL